MARVYIEPSGRQVLPFDDAPADIPIGNRPLSEWQKEMLAEAGLQRMDSPTPPCLVIPDNLFTTGPVLSRFVSQAAGRNAVLVLKRSLFGKSTTPVQSHVTATEQGWRFEKVRWVSDGGDDGEPVEVVIDPEEDRFEMPLPPGLGGKAEIALPRHPVMTLHHWVHILWANQAAAASIARRVPKWKWVVRALWAVIRGLSGNKWRVLGKINNIGGGCDIHPTAVIEGSTLGDNVTVGPHARILFSTIGDGANIMTGAQVEVSTVGPNAVVAQLTTLRGSVLYPEAFAGQYLMQACVLGRRAITTGAGFSMDVNFDRDIRVPLDGELHSTGTQFLGSAFGHNSRIGTGFWLASGRSIPNGAFVTRHPRDVIARIPDAAGDGRPWVNNGGTLVALDK
ncbi:MAG: hypothetical protein A2289_00085 [Deltaproteobacteria bacterium RIFOXYA12_FULL_58_15]|nr:MAG: hypothetical protein A2289_00085 [Deltaproteobacteria bacterium RIFOXYA12_FULL_58_15]OGR08919.1 MAG: hypothetical protein A2341_27850 [Deltaproteobacteria bacterium RIFOXYB12_FULL_58_9]